MTGGPLVSKKEYCCCGEELTNAVAGATKINDTENWKGKIETSASLASW
jgi:hypothetical protein